MTALLAIPEAAVKPILNAYHSDEMLAHPRTAIMNKLLRRRFFWPSMSSDVKRHVHRCSTCSRSAVGRRKASVQAKCQIYTQPAAVVGFDIVGPLKTNVRGEEKYVLSIQCYMTRFVVFVAIPNRKADTVVRALGPIRTTRRSRSSCEKCPTSPSTSLLETRR